LKDLSAHKKFRYVSEDQVKVITGQEEGLFGWISLNYMQNRFGETDGEGSYASGGIDPHTNNLVDVPLALTEKEKLFTAGLVEIGGASAQIAFEVDAQFVGKHAQLTADAKRLQSGDKQLFVDPFIDVNLDVRCDRSPVEKSVMKKKTSSGDKRKSHKYLVYSTTFLGYGANAARDRFVEMLTSNAASATVEDPCLIKGIEERVKGQDGKQYVLRGTGKYQECKDKQVDLLDRGSKCAFKQSELGGCIFAGVYQPALNHPKSDIVEKHKFYAFSEYWYTSKEVLHVDHKAFTKLHDVWRVCFAKKTTRRS
jgi:golgi apyrase